jgi:hypothetical protein
MAIEPLEKKKLGGLKKTPVKMAGFLDVVGEKLWGGPPKSVPPPKPPESKESSEEKKSSPVKEVVKKVKTRKEELEELAKELKRTGM